MTNEKIRQPIITVAGHVDHGKTSLLDRFRGTSIQEGEAGGITQKISFTRYPKDQLLKSCPLIDKSGINLEIPGFLFIDTPGHAAFTNLRKRGGSLADLAILVVNIKDGIKPQTAEVLQILKSNKTPFLVALNKIDSVSGWRYDKEKSLKECIESQSINVDQEFQESLLTFQGALSEHGFESDLYYDVSDFTKKIALVPCSARTGQGISELLFVLCGLCQRFLKERLKLNEDAKGVVLEVKKEKNAEHMECILYDGVLSEGDEIAIASLDSEPILSKVRSISEIEPLSFRYKSKESVEAATGLRLNLTIKDEVLSGMPFQKVNGNLEEIKRSFKKEVSGNLFTDKKGIIAKADSLGSLEALLTLLKQENISVVKAGIGPINKVDLISAKANLEIDELDAVIVGFNVEVDSDIDFGKIKVFTEPVVYKLIDNLKEWRTKRNQEIERAKIMSLAPVFKLEILPQFVFRNSNPAIFGVKVLGGTAKNNVNLFDESGEDVARIKGMQLDKASANEVSEGKEFAMSLAGINFERRLGDKKYLYSEISLRQFKEFKKNKDLLNEGEKRVLQEIAEIKRRKDESWGV